MSTSHQVAKMASRLSRSHALCLVTGFISGYLFAGLNLNLLASMELALAWTILFLSDVIEDERKLASLVAVALGACLTWLYRGRQQELARREAERLRKEEEERSRREKIEEQRALRQEALMMAIQKQSREELQEMKRREEERRQEMADLMKIETERREREREATEKREEQRRWELVEEFKRVEEERRLEQIEMREREQEKRAEEERRILTELAEIKKREEKKQREDKAMMLKMESTYRDSVRRIKEEHAVTEARNAARAAMNQSFDALNGKVEEVIGSLEDEDEEDAMLRETIEIEIESFHSFHKEIQEAMENAADAETLQSLRVGSFQHRALRLILMTQMWICMESSFLPIWMSLNSLKANRGRHQ